MTHRFNRYFVCFLDVLGFESQFSRLGLGGMLEKYTQLISVVDDQNEATQRLFGPLKFSEGAYLTAEGDAFISSRMHGAYASDSILLFANADFPENRYPDALASTTKERREKSKDPAEGWRYRTVPCDQFLDLCNEVICHSIEIGLPLRGAISMGRAVLHPGYGVFLGQPLIDSARLEHAQLCMGASFARTFMKQVIPKRYQLPFASHFKKQAPKSFSGRVLDWPRHWRATRSADVTAVVKAMNTATEFSEYYENTEAIVTASAKVAGLFEAPNDRRITSAYRQFSSPLLKLNLRLVRSESPELAETESDSPKG